MHKCGGLILSIVVLLVRPPAVEPFRFFASNNMVPKAHRSSAGLQGRRIVANKQSNELAVQVSNVSSNA